MRDQAESASNAGLAPARALIETLSSKNTELKKALENPPTVFSAALFTAHRRTLEAEFVGEPKLADFRHAEVLGIVRKAFAAESAGTSLFGDAANAGDLFRAYVSEVLAGSCIAFARFLPRESNERARHLKQAAGYLDLVSQTDAHTWVDAEVLDNVLKNGHRAEAQKLVAAALDRYPSSRFWQRRAGEAFIQSLAVNLKSNDDKTAAAMNASECASTLIVLTPLRERHAQAATLFEVEAEIRRIYAISLFNQNMFARSVAEARRAFFLEGRSRRSQETLDSLQQGLREFQAQLAKLEQSVAGDPTRRMSDEALAMKFDIERAITAHSARETADETKLAQQHHVAAVGRLWFEAGGDEIEGGVNESKTEGLLALLDRVPQGLEGAVLHGAVQDALADVPALSKMAPERVVAFVQYVRGEREAASPTDSLDCFATNLPAPVELPEAVKRPRTESFDEWWSSGQDGKFKAGMIASAALVVIFGAAFGLESWLLDRRDGAFAELIATPPADNPEKVIAAAQTYFGTPVLKPDKGRSTVALETFEEALRVRALQNPEADGLAQQRRIFEKWNAAYRSWSEEGAASRIRSAGS